MEPTAIFRQQGLAPPARHPQHFFPPNAAQLPQYVFHPQPPQPPQQRQQHPQPRDEISDNDAAPNRPRHVLPACLRCKGKKTGCDAGLPRCSKCQRVGVPCEFYDSTKGMKIDRSYLVRLKETVRQLEAEYARVLGEDDNYDSNEEIVTPGGMVRLNETDETPRYLGPSSGIAMTRLVMEEAKRYTESNRISELVPEVRARRTERMNRMQSIVSFRQSLAGPSSRKKSYPMVSDHPAESLPSRAIADRLVEVYIQRAQVLTPTLHEKALLKDVDAVFRGDNDPYRQFVVHIVMAISMQKLDTQYAGLADSYYLAAMQHFENVVRPKDLRTLQCLVLVGQYSLLTPTRTAVYFVIGLATRICQQLGLAEEKTITAGYNMGLVDPLTLDLRRRLCWIVATNEFGLAQSMGRPNGFAKTDDFMDVDFFATVEDENITEEGIKPGEPSGRKLVAIHFCKMRILQAEIRRMLYEKSVIEQPTHESDPWFGQMEEKMKSWLNSVPQKPEWCKPWFTGRYHTIVITLYRPSPQVPRPTPIAALRCYDSAAYIITLSSKQVEKAAIDITWVFLLTLYMALNTILWTLSYAEVRQAHVKDRVEELVNVALDIIEQCSERWPGTAAASQLYGVLAKACMQGYESREDRIPDIPLSPPPSFGTISSPSTSDSAPTSESTPTGPTPQQQAPLTAAVAPPQFGYVFDARPDEMNVNFTFDQKPSPFHNASPSFRSNSIFAAPASDSQGRRFSYFPPEFTSPEAQGRRGSFFPPDLVRVGHTPLSEQSEEPTPPSTEPTPQIPVSSSPFQSPFSNTMSPPVPPLAECLPSPPDSLAAPSRTHTNVGRLSPTPTFSSRGTTSSTPPIPFQSPSYSTAQPSPNLVPTFKQEPSDLSSYSNHVKQERAGMPGRQGFTNPPPTSARQRPFPPNTITDWFSPPPPFISHMAFSSGMTPGPWANPFIAPGSSAFVIGAGPGGSYNAPDAPRSYPFPGSNNNAVEFSNMFGGQDQAAGGMDYGIPAPERHGSLSQQQQMELMDALETDGLLEIDAFLQAPPGVNETGMEGIQWA